ncbi:major facilitator superfamily transporter [Fusarium beomiforme]|uniref:Major facilitator superfamily transporter n=1 Tax=Fusarium beomiforme TaxID=44412 RepID=A0A9P5E1Z0_9HYPO|nr:major facilitator superfamily transporter [Fusarium beomiforme]
MHQHHENEHESHASERTALLSPQSEALRSITNTHRTRCSGPWIYVVLLCIVLAVVSDVGESLYAAPRVRLFESVACTRYYLRHDPSLVDRHGSVPERFCKINSVQDKVALVVGWQYFFDAIPAILLPIPYGYVADLRGRKWILVLALVGYTLSWASTLFFMLTIFSQVGVLHLPLNAVWLSSLFFIIGGGPTTGTTLLTTVVADVVPAEVRSTVFFYRFCTDLVADLIVPPITSMLMHKNTWIPLLLAVAFQALSVILALGLPETLPVADPKRAGEDVDDISSAATSSDQAEASSKRGGKWRSWFTRTKVSFDFVIKDRVLSAFLFTFLISKVGRQAANMLFQYVSKRYGWTLAQAGFLISLRAGVNIALFTVILPFIATYMLVSWSPTSRDLWIGRASIILLVLGSFILFLSETAVGMIIGLVISTLGSGFAPTMRSLTTSLVESRHPNATSDIGRLYALISVAEGTGSLVAGPGMALAFRLGMSWGQVWLGLPFGLAALLFAFVSIILFSVKV